MTTLIDFHTPLKYKNILKNYLEAFSYASLSRYDLISFEHLLSYDAPIHFIDCTKINYNSKILLKELNNILSQEDKLIIYFEMLNPDIQIKSKHKLIDYYLFTVGNTHFVFQKEENLKLFIPMEKNETLDDIEEIQQDLILFLNKLKPIVF